ncbi:MAG: glycoside hydrolase family 3 N-terminal domain-containing protein, partial [Acidobacteriota bacterium]
IMTAHLTVPSVEPANIPATVSRRVLTGLLREELGFKGIVVTDAMDMAGLAKQFASGEASVRAIEAGADVLLMPPDPDAAIRAVLKAVASGRISRQRIDQSALLVLEAKVRVGLSNKKKLVDLDAVSDALDSDDEVERSQSVADRAVTLVRNEGAILPLSAPNQACLVVSAGIRLSSFGRRLADEFRRRAPQARIVFVDNSLPLAALDAVTGDVSACSAVVFATFTTSPMLPGDLPAYLEKLTQGSTRVALVSFGNPYLLTGSPNVAAYLDAFSTAPPSETSVAKALVGEIPITGHLPVSIPNLAQYGDGIQLPSKTQSAPPVN